MFSAVPLSMSITVSMRTWAFSFIEATPWTNVRDDLVVVIAAFGDALAIWATSAHHSHRPLK
jgi:threonine synthase